MVKVIDSFETNQTIRKAKKLVDAGTHISTTIAEVAVGAMMILIVASSVGRYLFNSPIPNTIDLVELFLLPLIIWFYMLQTQIQQDQITMDLLRGGRLSEVQSKIIDIIFHLVVVALLALAAEDLLISTFDLWTEDVWTQGEIALPVFLSRGIIAFGVITLLLVIVVQVVRWTKDLYTLIRQS